ncbi:MAG: hypothetical protein Q8L45_07940 [Xanthomonadaceae bacterium]|nr:hypothetical protein [Xanthomonadaceae bacterium]MDP2186251.1 hypothetical protein [Xanthomonadales bacterium]MDZ4114610.1 hypothetical protein [Xanthomonadaceae bacterium]MDZ4378999.1 hypothetical protein [Xanthomonadaceae bacterium]
MNVATACSAASCDTVEGAEDTHPHVGMPRLDTHGKAVSFFEFWPSWLVYTPVALQWLGLSLRHGSLTVPLCANPALPLSGMVGVSKSLPMSLAGDHAQGLIAPFVRRVRGAGLGAEPEADAALAQARAAGLDLPLVAKPDIGCRGAGVRLIQNIGQLRSYVSAFPDDAAYLLQELVPWEGEAGIFYVRRPGQVRGDVFSMTLKYAPYVLGDGVRSLRQLIQDDPRASQIAHIYFARHAERLDQVLAAGEAMRLVFSGSHCRGSVFRDGRAHISEALVTAIDRLFADLPGMHYSRLDVRFRDIAALREGRDFRVIEINGASSEATHVWDRNGTLGELYRTLFFQYRTLFEIGVHQRRQGAKPPRLRELLRAWRHERALTHQYPSTD